MILNLSGPTLPFIEIFCNTFFIILRWNIYKQFILKKEMAAYSSILAWEISWEEEPGGLQSMGS